MTKEIKTKCGYVAVIGRPNVGKSTLLNQILGTKLSIVTSKPQTTRNRVLAVHNEKDLQMIFLDTPGIHKPVGSLGRYMNDAAQNALTEADICLWLIDMRDSKREAGLTNPEHRIAQLFKEKKTPVIVLLNKIDILKDKSLLLPVIKDVSACDEIIETIPISAKTGEHVGKVMEHLRTHLPQGAKLFPEDILSDKADRFFVSEYVREALTNLTHKEIPYKTAVVIDQYIEESKGCTIHATIHVERNSQKGIIIGKGGHMIKEIGTKARAEVEKMLDCNVNLMLHVGVTKDWSNNPVGIKKMGYDQ